MCYLIVSYGFSLTFSYVFGLSSEGHADRVSSLLFSFADLICTSCTMHFISSSIVERNIQEVPHLSQCLPLEESRYNCLSHTYHCPPVIQSSSGYRTFAFPFSDKREGPLTATIAMNVKGAVARVS